jgi:hypothetical protein
MITIELTGSINGAIIEAIGTLARVAGPADGTQRGEVLEWIARGC